MISFKGLLNEAKAPMAPFRRLSMARGVLTGGRRDLEAALREWAKTAQTVEDRKYVIDEVVYAISSGAVNERKVAKLTSLATFEEGLGRKGRVPRRSGSAAKIDFDGIKGVVRKVDCQTNSPTITLSDIEVSSPRGWVSRPGNVTLPISGITAREALCDLRSGTGVQLAVDGGEVYGLVGQFKASIRHFSVDGLPVGSVVGVPHKEESWFDYFVLTVGSGWWRLLWSTSLQGYNLAGPFDGGLISNVEEQRLSVTGSYLVMRGHGSVVLREITQAIAKAELSLVTSEEGLR